MKMRFWFKMSIRHMHGAQRLLCEFLDKGWKHGSIDCLLKRSHKTGAVSQQPSRCRLRLALSSGGPRAESGGRAKKATISSRFWQFKCAQDNSLRYPAQMLQTVSCSAVAWSQSRCQSHYLINNLIICNKSCCCFLWTVSQIMSKYKVI